MDGPGPDLDGHPGGHRRLVDPRHRGRRPLGAGLRSESDLGDPRAEVRVRRAGLDLPAAPVRLTRRDARVENLTVRALARPVRDLVATPRTGRLLAADEFDSGALDGWTWVRENPDAEVTGGRLPWPVEGKDLVGDGNDAGVLLRSTVPNADAWIAETKVDLDLGEDTVRNYQQAGIIAYRNDDDFARLSKVAIWNTRQTEYGRELVATAAGETSYGGAVIGTPARPPISGWPTVATPPASTCSAPAPAGTGGLDLGRGLDLRPRPRAADRAGRPRWRRTGGDGRVRLPPLLRDPMSGPTGESLPD